MLSDVRPAVHEEIRVGLRFRELDARVGLEGVPKAAAAIAHELHFGLVFFVARDEFAPTVLQAELLGQQVVRMRAVVRQLRPLCDSIPQRGENHITGWRPRFFRAELAKAVAVGIEGDLQIGVFGDSARVGSVGHDAPGPGRGEAHLVDPNVPGKFRFRRPLLACAEASSRPKLGGFDVDSGDFGDDPIRAVQHYRRQCLSYLLRRQFRRRKRGARRIGVVPTADQALVPGDSIAPLPVFDERGVASRAPWVPFLDLAKEAFRNLEASSSRLEASETSRSIALEISSSAMDSTAVLSNIKIPSDCWEASRGKGYRQTTRPERLPTVSDCLEETLYYRAFYPTFAGISRLFSFLSTSVYKNICGRKDCPYLVLHSQKSDWIFPKIRPQSVRTGRSWHLRKKKTGSIRNVRFLDKMGTFFLYGKILAPRKMRLRNG